ncbi:Regulator of protease activity HflC, stomatin/prohibitin superfamily [Actinacidiphila yanglinensis]|uniref:Regulator of protease activity HflC, stomatin/prohibitin superfamily n=1 Tax=Actinacidiphila yanglinensis TaxID=310779 RepID=A0A1H5XB82_9ACTN|nr:SPFH domain-containing protein [Actinacidiphila yanglinensis]SEG08700.1 Regulator of protease activity HflC, stomatin/prohibitin superfamily [Actinacidiphila yanglinensis]
MTAPSTSPSPGPSDPPPPDWSRPPLTDTAQTLQLPAALPWQARDGAREEADPGVPGPLDTPVERPGPSLPGWVAALVALAAALAAAGLLWRAGALPSRLERPPLPRPPRTGTGGRLWAGLAPLAAVGLLALSGLVRGRPGTVRVLSCCGGYRGTVRRTGLLWISPLLRRRRFDVTLRHWRSHPIDTVDAGGTPLRISLHLVWRVRDTARAVYGVRDHDRFLREAVEAAVARVAARHPVDDFGGDRPTLRDCERVADDLTRLIAAEVRMVGVEVFSATPVRIDYAPELAAAMRRARVAAVDAKRRKVALDEVLAAVGETLRGISERGLGQLDEYETKALVRDLTVALLKS